jgi:hypothetical protein
VAKIDVSYDDLAGIDPANSEKLRAQDEAVQASRCQDGPKLLGPMGAFQGRTRAFVLPADDLLRSERLHRAVFAARFRG